MDKTNIEKQLELLSNNTETLEISKNYLTGVQESITVLTELASQINDKVNYAIRAVEISKEGFEAVNNNITEIINAEDIT